MRKPIGLFVAAFATVAGGGLAFAIEDDGSSTPPPAEETVESQNLFAEEDSTTSSSTSTTVEDEAELQAEAEVDDEAGPPEDAHGFDVSQAAHECPGGDESTEETTDETTDESTDESTDETTEGAEAEDAAEGTHGECVSLVARDHDGDQTPDHGPGSPDFPGDEEHGQGNGHGQDEGD